MPPEASDMLCGDWAWDAAMREMRHFPRKGKGWADQPDAVERLGPVRSVAWHRWSQLPMATHTGDRMPGVMSRIVVAYEGGGNLTINESDRDCAGKIAQAIADAYRLPVTDAGAPDGRRSGNLPPRDAMGRLVTQADRAQVVLDESAGDLTITKPKRFFGNTRRTIRTTEIRRLELGYDVLGPTEVFTVWAIVGPEEEKLPVAQYRGYEGWADPEEWRQFTQELGRSLGVEARVRGGARL